MEVSEPGRIFTGKKGRQRRPGFKADKFSHDVYKYDQGIILRQVVLIFLLVVLLYWLGKLPGTFSPAEKKGEGGCDTAEAIPIAPHRVLDYGAPATGATLSAADPIYSQIPNYSQGNGQATG